jgi:hypothetical protein
MTDTPIADDSTKISHHEAVDKLPGSLFCIRVAAVQA